MRRMLCWVSACVCLGVCARQAVAEDVAKLAEADRKQVGEWMAQRATVMIDAHKLECEVGAAWSDKTYTSPEVEALRARYLELQQELVRTQSEIQKKVREVPAMQTKVRQIEELKKKELELTKKIAEKVGE